MASLHDSYDAVIAFDHPTLATGPDENVDWLARWLAEVPSEVTFDVVAHSRGGLVGRVLAERAADVGLSGKVTVRNFVMVASPNAGTVLALRKTHGSLAGWLDAHQFVGATAQGRHGARKQRDKAEWVSLVRKTFRFTGGEIVGEFLLSAGYLPGAHRASCPVYARIGERKPAWMRTGPAS